MSPQPAVLVGTVHLDPSGPGWLEGLLHALEPEVITLEMSRWGLLFRRREGPRLLGLIRSHLGGRPPSERLAALMAAIELPYEYTVTERYAQSHKIRLVPVDVSRFSHDKLSLLESEALAPENIEALQEDEGFSLSRSAMEQRLLAMRYRHDSSLFPWHFDGAAREEMSERARRMARCIAWYRARARRVVHVGGWAHLVRVGEGGMRTLVTELGAMGVPFVTIYPGEALPEGLVQPRGADRTEEGAAG